MIRPQVSRRVFDGQTSGAAVLGWCGLGFRGGAALKARAGFGLQRVNRWHPNSFPQDEMTLKSRGPVQLYYESLYDI